MGLDTDTGFADGSKDPTEVFTDIDDLIIVNKAAALDTFLIKNYNALTDNDPVKKKVFGRFKEPVPARLSVIDVNTGTYIATSTKFLLTSVRREKSEKFQILRGFSEEFLFSVFGKNVSVYSFSGVLMNLSGGISDEGDDGRGIDWVRDMDEFYDEYLRAYKLVTKKGSTNENRQAVLTYSNRLIRGYIINKAETDDSNNETYTGFSMNMIVRKDRMY